MFSLILMTCINLDCQHIEVVSQHLTMAACKAAMEEKWNDLESGEGLMCIEVASDKE